MERPDLAPGVAGDDRVADAERPALDEHRRDRTAADVEPGLDDRPRRVRLRVGLQLELGVGDEQDLLEQLVEPGLLPRRDARDLDVAAPLLGLEALGGEIAEHPVGVGVRQVDLVHRDDDRHLGRAGVRDRLLRLRHDAVVGGDDEDGDVGHLRAAGAHRRERLVAGRVQERDLPAVDGDLVRADVLGDPARLGLDDLGVADRVEQRRLAVVDVAHDRDHGRPRDEVLRVVLDDLGLDLLVVGVLDRDLALQLGGEQLDLVVGQRLRRGLQRAEAHQDLDDVLHPDADRLGEVADGDPRLEADRPGRLDDLARLLRRRRSALVARAAVVGRGRAAPVSITTRRLRPGPPPWRGLIGLFGPSAMDPSAMWAV